MKLSLQERILAYYRKHDGEWISGGNIERLVVSSTTYKASNASRRLRELHEDGKLERQEVKGTVFYRYIPQKKVVKEVVIEGDRAVEVTKTVMV